MILGTCVLTPWYLLGLFPSPCRGIVYAVISLTALLVEKHSVKHCGWHLKCKTQRCLKGECAEDHGSVAFLLWGFFPCGVFFLCRLHLVVSLPLCRFWQSCGDVTLSLVLGRHFLLPSISIFHTLYFFFSFLRDLGQKIMILRGSPQKKCMNRFTGHTIF